MKTFHQFVSEAYDADLMRSASVKTTGAGGRVAPERKKTAPEMRRMKQAKAGETRQPTSYKPRKDIGNQSSSRSQQPTQDRGSADVKARAAAAAKAERKKAALARIAAKKSVTTAKPTSKELEKAGTQLISKKKKETVSPDYKPQKASGKTEAERKAITKQGEKYLRDLRLKNLGKKSEKELKHPITTKEIARRKKEGQ